MGKCFRKPERAIRALQKCPACDQLNGLRSCPETAAPSELQRHSEGLPGRLSNNLKKILKRLGEVIRRKIQHFLFPR